MQSDLASMAYSSTHLSLQTLRMVDELAMGFRSRYLRRVAARLDSSTLALIVSAEYLTDEVITTASPHREASHV